MTIWFAMLIPFCFAGGLLVGFRHRIAWWEILVPFAVSALTIFAAKAVAVYSLVYDTEYWTGYAVQSEYYEDWTEHCETVSVDSEGNLKTDTFYVYHPAYWTVEDSNGIQVSVSSERFESLSREWGNKQYVSVFRPTLAWGRGDKYVTRWNGTSSTGKVVTTTHPYSNKIQAARNVFDFKSVTPEQRTRYALHDYPNIDDPLTCPTVLGQGMQETLQKRFCWTNAILGKSREIRLWVLLFQDQPVEAAVLQESYWLRGNKNELIICVGLHGDSVQWCRTFSWADRDRVKTMHEEIEVAALQADFTWDRFHDFIEATVQKYWVRKNFHDFDYIGLTVPVWGQILAYLLTIGCNIAVSIWAVTNDADLLDQEFNGAFRFNRC